MAGGGGSGSVRSMNDTLKANREALKTSNHNQSYLKANSIRNNRKSNGKHLISAGIGLALICISIWFGSMAISLGGYLRARDAISAQVLFEFHQFAIGASYDFNISGLKPATNARGGLELSLRFTNKNPF